MDDSKSRCEVCYYITGHGLGHATRSLEVIRILLSSNRFIVHIVTQVKSDFFVSNLSEFDSTMFSYSCRALDTGAHQQDVFVVDMVQSLAQYSSTIHQNRQRLLDYEVQWLKDKHITLVLVDATPVGCEAGRLAGATTVVVSNFTWDFCYKEMLREVSAQDVLTPRLLEQYQSMVHQCELDSSACSYYLQLPGATPLPAPFDQSKLVRGPLLARGVRNANLRTELNIPSDARILLLGFGGHSAAWQLQDSFLPSGWVCLVLGGAKEEDMPSSRFRVLALDVYVPDLIHLADVVLGKLGYGFVSECLTLGTPLIYVPRQNWPEERYLESLLVVGEYGAGVRMLREDFASGNWEHHIEQAAALKNSWVVPTDNAADRILSFITSIT